MLRPLFHYVLLLLALNALPASSATILIANGSAPPDPTNVVSSGETGEFDTVIVRNAGCGTPTETSPCPNPGAPTAVAVVPNAVIGQTQVRDTSSVVSNGFYTRSFATYDSASFTASSGYIDSGYLYGSSTVTLQGTVSTEREGLIDLNDASRITLSAGIGGSLSSDPGTFVTLTSGILGLGAGTYASIRGGFEMLGGEIFVSGLVLGGSARMTAGKISAVVSASASSSFHQEGGDVSRLSVDGTAKLSGGRLTFDISGSIPSLGVGSTGNVEISGSNFTLDGQPVALGNLVATSGVLAGTYLSGTNFSYGFTRNPTGSIVLVPEPGTGLLLAAGLAGLAIYRRARR